MNNMRKLINLVEDHNPYNSTNARILHNAKVLQSNIKYIEVDNTALHAKLNTLIAELVGLLEQV